jgi:hypothetical protein
MTKSLLKSQLKRKDSLKKIKIEGNVDEGREVIVCCKTATLKWKGFESQMAMLTKVYERV